MECIEFLEKDRFIPSELNLPEIKDWLSSVAKGEGGFISELNFHFTSDDFLFNMNSEYLSHETYTDIITFEYGNKEQIVGDIFISVDRVKENSIAFKSTFKVELLRVIIHGLLHLLGYGDKTESEKKVMRSLEDSYLSLWGK